MKEINIEPLLENLDHVTAFIETELSAAQCPGKTIFQINIAIDELYSNIVHYSGATSAIIRYEIKDRSITISFIDNGKPYDPTRQGEPDVSLSSEERGIGGLGIFMVRKSMDEMIYEFADGKNVLTIRKGW